MEKEPITVRGLEKLKEEDMQNSIYYMIEARNLDFKQMEMLMEF